MQPSIPVAPRDRFLTLDVLRGVALLGILVMNMPAFSWTHWPGLRGEQIWPAWWDGAEMWVARWFFSGKFNSLFSLLFGIGFTLQLERLNRSGGAVTTYLRKLAALAVLGAVHAILIWRGDVLLTYVEIGLLLLLVRRASDVAILTLAGAAIVAGPIVSAVHTLVVTPNEFAADEQKWALLTKVADTAYAHGSFADATRARLVSLRESYGDPWTLAWHGQMLGTALLGCFAGRRRYVTSPEQHRALLRKIFLGAIALGLVSIVAWSVLRGSWKPHAISLVNNALGALYTVQRPAIMVAYVSGFLLMLTAERLPKEISRVASAGRMPLTNYISQSLICTTPFYAHGFGLYNQVGPAGGFALAIAIYSVRVEASAWWLRRHAFGPIEWLWRTMTYGRVPSVVAAPSQAAVEAANGTSLASG